MMAFFDNRTAREKVLLAALSALLVLWLGLVHILTPVLNARREMASRIPRIERALEMAPLAVSAAKVPEARPLPALVTDAAEAFGLGISRLQPAGSKVELALEDAAFETVLLWVEAMERDDGLHLSELHVTRGAAPGIVGVTLTLER